MGTQNVLIVDDRPTNQNIFAKLAQTMEGGKDIVVRTCGDPVDALELLDTFPPDLIIVDYSMPGMTGAEFTRTVRGRPTLHDVPIIVITAYADRDFRLTALEAGATDFLQSPVDRNEFQSRARALLAFRREQLSVRDRAASIGRSYEAIIPDLTTLLGTADAIGQVLDAIPVIVLATDHAHRCLFANSNYLALVGGTPDTIVGRDVTDLMTPAIRESSHDRNDHVLKTGSALPPYEQVTETNGVSQVYLTYKSPLRDAEDRTVGVLTASIDITGRKRAETHLNHLARHDVLTGLPNRILFRDRLQAEIDKARDSGRCTAVFLIDLDRFKLINDTRGHHVGDQLLEKVAERVSSLLESGDCGARLGGDEFAIIQTNLADDSEVAERAQRMLNAIEQTFRLDQHEVVLTASLGISVAPHDGMTPDELLRTADLAMYEAKGAGGNAFRFYRSEMSSRAQTAATLEADLRVAIDQHQFVLHYQPLFAARTGLIDGVEALIRWQHPALGLLQPGAFLQLAEETGLIIPIGAWVIDEACRQLVAWRRGGFEVPVVSVNLSPLQFQRQDVFGLVETALATHGLPGASLRLEIVESVLVTNRKAVADTLERLRRLGAQISIDDFGTGYSSFQYLRDLPFDNLKIDRSFIAGLPGSAPDAAIVHAITSLGHDLGFSVTAEGVETEDQRLILRAIGCDTLQGYHLGRPGPPDIIAALVADQKAAPMTVQPGLPDVKA